MNIRILEVSDAKLFHGEKPENYKYPFPVNYMAFFWAKITNLEDVQVVILGRIDFNFFEDKFE